jgi:hypothetical protein
VRESDGAHLLLLRGEKELVRALIEVDVLLYFKRLIYKLLLERVAPLVQKHRRNKLIFPLVYIERVELGG